MVFDEFQLSEELLRGILDMGFEEASPIQAASMAPLLEGRDVIGQAQTGTGKTAAFGIPMLEKVSYTGQVEGLILAPTRELCLQVANELIQLSKYKKNLHILPVYGGTGYERQLKALKKGVQIVVGTPGRVMDHLRRGTLDLSGLKMAVLDEADEMFAMGFRDDMKTILDQTPEGRQTCFFSATMGQEIKHFSKIFQRDPEVIQIKHKELTVENIQQYYLEMTRVMKTEILTRLVDLYNPQLAMVFCNTKRGVDELVSELTAAGYSVDGLHGDLKQTQRDTVMRKFREGVIDILVATDVAARGIDVGNVDVVFNYDLPQDEEYYVHRIGRTARAGRSGRAFTFVVGRDIYKLQDIMRYTKAEMEYMELPTMASLHENAEAQLMDQILSALEKEQDLTKYKQVIDQLLNMQYGGVEIAAVLLKMVADARSSRSHKALDQVDYGKKFRRSELKKKGKERGKKARKRGDGSLYLSKGRKDGVSPKMILALFKKHTPIPKGAIGNILIRDKYTLVDLPAKDLKAAQQQLDGLKVGRGKLHAEIRDQ
ncbi:MAG: DEAD/DEAH box helicase [Tissierellia bacterium]|nr:DEAD/DEAH box helicase [Tissierellia bacterium]